ncbi:acanthoscurrin-2-like, partial [Penaeus japonicus]|uniref:acanthoscurrin-2-like n=1 Tax=Penaeus japonicus TaxID=27405 RepID=UPI001C70C9CF
DSRCQSGATSRMPSGVTQSGGRGGGEYPRGGYGQGRGGGGYGGGGYGQGRGGGGYGGGYGGGGYGGGGYGRGGYGGGQNTVVIDRGNDGIGNFATGMMLGSALGGWGHGWGFGYGFGVPMHMGFGGFHGAGFHNQVCLRYVCRHECIHVYLCVLECA